MGLLAPLMALVTGGKARPAVCSFIMVPEEPFFIEPEHRLDWKAQAVVKEANMGSELFIPHVPKVFHLAEMVCALNSWNERRADQADLDWRLAAHKDINVRLQTATDALAVDWMALVLYNCFHFVPTVSDGDPVVYLFVWWTKFRWFRDPATGALAFVLH